MIQYEYKVIPAPTRGLKGKGVKGPDSRFANALETLMNEMGVDGWDYQRAETLPSEERAGLTGKNTIFRNVLVLIWILIIMAVFIAVLPQPRDFRGNDPSASMFLDLFAFTGRGFYLPRPIFTAEWAAGGMGWWLVIASLIGSFFGTRAMGKWASRTQEQTGIRPVTWYYTLGIWFAPLLIIFLIGGLGWETPALKGFNFQGGIFARNSFIALTFALAIYTAAFIAENVRAGILAISKGQTEAAASLGLRPNRIMNLVILPQALRVIIPPLISNYLNLTKNSSLAIAVGYMDLTGTLMGITMNQTGRELETVMLGMLVYLTISLLISSFMNWYNNRVKLVER